MSVLMKKVVEEMFCAVGTPFTSREYSEMAYSVAFCRPSHSIEKETWRGTCGENAPTYVRGRAFRSG